MTHHNQNKSGFALLISLVVVSVVVSVGLVILDLTLKQLSLSTNSKESEAAVHAANAGLECARFWRNEAALAIENGGSGFNPICFGGSEVMTVDDDFIPTSTGADAFSYTFESTWGDKLADRCSEVTMIVMVSSISNPSTVLEADITSLIPGYPEGNKVCPAGGICTILSSRGYSRACNNKDLAGTIQREVLLEL